MLGPREEGGSLSFFIILNREYMDICIHPFDKCLEKRVLLQEEWFALCVYIYVYILGGMGWKGKKMIKMVYWCVT